MYKADRFAEDSQSNTATTSIKRKIYYPDNWEDMLNTAKKLTYKNFKHDNEEVSAWNDPYVEEGSDAGSFLAKTLEVLQTVPESAILDNSHNMPELNTALKKAHACFTGVHPLTRNAKFLELHVKDVHLGADMILLFYYKAGKLYLYNIGTHESLGLNDLNFSGDYENDTFEKISQDEFNRRKAAMKLKQRNAKKRDIHLGQKMNFSGIDLSSLPAE